MIENDKDAPRKVSKAYRKLNKLTQEQFSAESGIPLSTIQFIERGKDIRLSTMRLLYSKTNCKSWVTSDDFFNT